MNTLTPSELNFVLDEVNQYIAIISTDHTLTYANKQLLDFSGVHLEHIDQLPYWELPWWQNGMSNQNKLMFAVERAFFGETVRFDATYMKYDGSLHEIDFILKPMYKNSEIDSVIAMGYNISDLVKTQKALTRRQKQLDDFFQFSSDGYFFYLLDHPTELPEIDDVFLAKLITHQKLVFFNHKLEQILNRKFSHDSKLIDIFPNEGNRFLYLWREMIAKGSVTFDTEVKLNSTSLSDSICETDTNSQTLFDEIYDTLFLRVVLVAIYDEQNFYEGNFAIVRDRTTEVMNISRLEFLANKDPLTKIDNRRSFYTKATALLEDAMANQHPICAAMIDIDHFKKINDTYGHDAGDTVLYHFATLIDQHVKDHGIIARYGGEEFVMMLKTNIDDAYKILESLRIAISKMVVDHEEHQIKLTASIGIRENISRTDNVDTLIAEADTALYYSKTHGRNKVSVFSRMNQKKEDRIISHNFVI